MITTSFLIEFLITGFQVAIWLILIFLSIFGIDWFVFEKIKGSEIIAFVLALPIVYPIGIFVDDLAGILLDKWNRRIREKHFPGKYPSVVKLLVVAKNEWLAAIFDHHVTIIRLSRATALNFLIITIVLPIFILTRLDSIFGASTWRVAALGLVTSALITIFALWSWQHITNILLEQLKPAFELFPQAGVIESSSEDQEKIP
jgi:hypothetical protein